MQDIDVDYSYHDSLKSLVHSVNVKCVRMEELRVSHSQDRKFHRINNNLILMNARFVLLILYDFDNSPHRQAICRSVLVVNELSVPASVRRKKFSNHCQMKKAHLHDLMFTFDPIELQTSNRRVLNSNGRQLQILFWKL